MKMTKKNQIILWFFELKVNLKFYKKIKNIKVILSLLLFKISQIDTLHKIENLGRVKFKVFELWGYSQNM